MPKRNAFYFFMLDFKEEQRKRGIQYANMTEVSIAAGPAWTEIDPSIRAKFEAKAKQVNNSKKDCTSTGVSLSEIEAKEIYKKKLEESERQHIFDFINSKISNKSNFLKEVIYLIDVNSYCKAYGYGYLIGEITLMRFNLKDGIIDNYYQMINPGPIPRGYHYEVKLGAKEFGLDYPDESVNGTDKVKLLATIMEYLKMNNQNDNGDNSLPDLYTLPDKVPEVRDFMRQLCYKTDQDYTMFHIYKLDILLFAMVNGIKVDPDDGFPKEWLAARELMADRFKYSPGLGCEHHRETDKSVQCTQARTKRWAYTILAACLPLLPVTPAIGTHVPEDIDLERILDLQQQKSCLSQPLAPQCKGLCCAAPTAQKEHANRRSPVRMPKTIYSKKFLASSLMSTCDALSSCTIGTGRGRGLGRGRRPDNNSK